MFRICSSFPTPYHLCNTDECMRKLQTNIRHRSSTWKKQEVQLLRWMNFRWKTFKIVASMKKWSTRESCVFTAAFHRYITCSIPVSGWRAMSSGWRATGKQSTWKIEWSSGTRAEKFRFFTRCIFEESVSRWRYNEWYRRFRNYIKMAMNQRKP